VLIEFNESCSYPLRTRCFPISPKLWVVYPGGYKPQCILENVQTMQPSCAEFVEVKARLRATVCRPCTWLIASYYSQTCRCISSNNISIFFSFHACVPNFCLRQYVHVKFEEKRSRSLFVIIIIFHFLNPCILYKDYAIKLLTWDFVIIIVLTSSIVFLLWYFLSRYI